MTINELLAQNYPAEIVQHIIDSFSEIEQNFRIEKWKPSELDAGHFVEAVRRLLEHELFGNYTPFNQSVGTFNQGVLNRFESSSGEETYRILIPRILYSMYCIRNKRGVGHISTISPNKLDATYILYSAKWVLSELIRMAEDISPEDAQLFAEQVIERQVDLIWEDGETFMILDKRLKAAEKVLLALYKKDNLPIEDLRLKIDYKNKSNFKKIMLGLKNEKLLDMTDNGLCKLSPLGVIKAEAVINSL